MRALSWNVEDSGGVTRVSLSGEITEDVDFRVLIADLQGEVVLDLAEIARINSCGVREWINFVAELEGKGCKLAFERCSPVLVQQLNMISNFRGGGEVRSLHAPYCCDDCGHEDITLLVIAAGIAPTIEETRTCPECGSDMEFDDLPETYLAFLEG